jgi:hypothetical protein
LKLIEKNAFEQAKDTRILQRAYLSVKAAGVEGVDKDGKMMSCDLVFHNVGNLPARRVRWFITSVFSGEESLRNFPIVDSDYIGNHVISPGTEIRQGTPLHGFWVDAARLRVGDEWLYVWGDVRYDDGFGNERFTKFCYRYNVDRAGPTDRWFKPKHARSHTYGNEAT